MAPYRSRHSRDRLGFDGRIAPQFEGLAARLDGPDGCFLDVGTGVARLSIAMAQRWPALHVVGIDTWKPALSLAKNNVAAAGLQHQIDLREQDARNLVDEKAFDLAWIPAPFIQPDGLAQTLESVYRALRPGGWLLFATAKPGNDLKSALMELRVASWGGQVASPDEIERRLANASFTQIKVLPGPPRDFKMVVAARRAPTE